VLKRRGQQKESRFAPTSDRRQARPRFGGGYACSRYRSKAAGRVRRLVGGQACSRQREERRRGRTAPTKAGIERPAQEPAPIDLIRWRAACDQEEVGAQVFLVAIAFACWCFVVVAPTTLTDALLLRGRLPGRLRRGLGQPACTPGGVWWVRSGPTGVVDALRSDWPRTPLDRLLLGGALTW